MVTMVSKQDGLGLRKIAYWNKLAMLLIWSKARLANKLIGPTLCPIPVLGLQENFISIQHKETMFQPRETGITSLFSLGRNLGALIKHKFKHIF